MINLSDTSKPASAAYAIFGDTSVSFNDKCAVGIEPNLSIIKQHIGKLIDVGYITQHAHRLPERSQDCPQGKQNPA
jgi:hypothetical protein